MTTDDDGLYITLISVHGLIRGRDLELGRDADTGGQILYVVELARALAEHPDVARVDLITRLVRDSRVDSAYAEPEEQIADNAFIVRFPCGPDEYLPKEKLWPYLDSFADQVLDHLQRVGRIPHVIHSHYADAGYVGARLVGWLDVPLIHTGHSLGRVKRQRLQDQGLDRSTIEQQYNISRRIEAEELSLDNAAFVVASTRQEVDEQYSAYNSYQPERMVVIPPGVDLRRFHPPRREWLKPDIYYQLARFLRNPRKPMILALSRADVRKNIGTLVRAFGEHEDLRELANLVVIAGNRDDIQDMEKGSRFVLTELLQFIDRYDLYGHVAYPKHHEPDDVPHLYRLVARSRGVFVNPALTEPFGLTLLEAAASGVPIVATEDGGPRDIVGYCKNGVLVDPLDTDAMAAALRRVLTDRVQWNRWSKSGLSGVHKHFSWPGHVSKYLREVRKVLRKSARRRGTTPVRTAAPRFDRLLICDIDDTLIGDADALHAMLKRIRSSGVKVGFGVATGRSLQGAREALAEQGVEHVDLLITAVGSEIYYGDDLSPDEDWLRHISFRWRADAIRREFRELPGLKPQDKSEQRRFKISYLADPEAMPPVADIVRHLRVRDLHANVIFSHGAFLDILPIRASKGGALRYVAMRWGIPVENILVAGDSGNDEEMLRGNTMGVVVGNHSEELERLRSREHVYFADGNYSWGVIEGMDHFRFLGRMRRESSGGGLPQASDKTVAQRR